MPPPYLVGDEGLHLAQAGGQLQVLLLQQLQGEGNSVDGMEGEVC